MGADVVVAVDQGTTSSRALVFDREARILGSAARELRTSYPHPGWVEQDPEEIWRTTLEALRAALLAAGVQPDGIAAIGITNQRETSIVWDRSTGLPVYPAIVWQSRQTADICAAWRAEGLEERIAERTGLTLDPYFSASKIRFILDLDPAIRERAVRGELAFGTVDTWLLWRLTDGAVHATDASNASRTLLYDIRRARWDEELAERLGIPLALLPEVRDTSGVFGGTAAHWLDGVTVPLAGAAGDQQAALFGQACLAAGTAKNTYGTGCFLLMNTGTTAVRSHAGLLTSVAWQKGGRVEYALEGSVFSAGAAVQWLRDGLGIIGSAAESEAVSRSVADTAGVYLVPAFTGLGAPYWDANARGLIAGLTRGTGRAHLVRATLESLAYQTRDVLQAMEADAGVTLNRLRVDGGASQNEFLMQFQADILGRPVERARTRETTAMGAAFLAGLATGFWNGEAEVASLVDVERTFLPEMAAARREELYRGWQAAVRRARS